MSTLARRSVLLLDAQTTGANPRHGHLLELGWARACAATPADVTPCTALVQTPDPIPRRIQELTGITPPDMAQAHPPEAVYRALIDALAGLDAPALVVIHYARFETPFLLDLHARFGPPDPFPAQLLCTHEIARRLFPDLPRRGIRALSGYLGHPILDLKRAGEHALATATIWSELVARLAVDGVDTPDALSKWLAATRPARRARFQFSVDRAQRLSLPDAPGVYRMLSRTGEVLYVGKATSLKARVNSYFQKRRGHSEKTLELLTCAHDIAVTPTGSALEAALLESDEIKRCEPPYNIALRLRDRQLGFARPDLTPLDPDEPAAIFLGPLPSPSSLEALTLLRGALTPPRHITEHAVARILCVVPPFVPDLDCFSLGLDLFTRAHGIPSGPPSPEDFWRLGARIWSSIIKSKEVVNTQNNDVEFDLEEPEECVPFVWSPEAVSASLEAVVSTRAAMVRRGQWLCRLAESSLVWSPKRGAARRALIISQGQIVKRGDLEPGQPAPPPLFPSRTAAQRRAHFTPAVYDRLRVMSTELRRLALEGARIELRTGPAGEVNRAALIRLLAWI